MASNIPPEVHDTLYEYSYQGEGNAHLVIANHLKREAIRFKKSLPEGVPIDGGLSRVIREIKFMEVVMLKFLGTYVDELQMVHYDRELIEKFLIRIRRYRPWNRISKEILEEYATKLPDYTSLPKYLYADQYHRTNNTFCVEIKPKQGFICKADKHFPKCPYCLKQFFKAKVSTRKEHIVEINKYCPLELFSGDRHRMKKAILNLIDNPQNNLRIFRNNTVKYDEDSIECHKKEDIKESLDRLFSNRENESWESCFCTLLVEILLHPFLKVKNEAISVPVLEDVQINLNKEIPYRIDPNLKAQANKLLCEKCQSCDFFCGDLPRGSVLERIFQVQKLHQYGEDVIYSIYSKYQDTLSNEILHHNIINRFESCTFNASKFMKSINVNEYINNDSIFDKTKTEHKYFSVDELSILQNYLLFSTMRDCSIMIVIHKIDSEELQNGTCDNIIEISEHQKYMVNVKIADVDLKSVHCIEKHRKRDEEVLNAVISTLSQKH